MNFRSIYDKTRMKNPSIKRKISENYVVQNIIIKKITPFFAYPLHKIGISADSITIFSFITIIFAGVFFVLGHGNMGCFFILLFGFLDSLDGDMARLNKSKTLHGETLDTLGADLFYIIIPFSITFFLYNQNLENYFLKKETIIIVGFLISFLLTFNRVLALRNYILFFNSKSLVKKKKSYKKKFSFTKSFFLYFENECLRGNFFSEPGFILNFSILIFINSFQFLYYYFLVILFYLFIIFIKLFIGTIILYKGN
jgi:phosphatidylglycerophosphate synthase